jgi:ABC-2 type transport system permease protein
MIGTFLWLGARTVRNRLRRQARELRNPRYVVALAAGLVYLWFILRGQGRPAPVAETRPVWLETLLAAVLLGTALWAWVIGAERRVLAFSPAEVQFLFPAPVTRRALVHYKLLRSQLLILLNALFWALFLSREAMGVSPVLRAVGVWVLLSTMQMHRLGASFARAAARGYGRSVWRSHPVAAAAAVAILGAALATVLGALPSLHRAALVGAGELGRALLALAHAPVLAVLLMPFRLVVRPLVALDAGEWLRAAGPAVLVLVAHYLWVVRADTAFEELAAEASFARARDAVARRASGLRALAAPGASAGPPVVRLSSRGHPAVALAWKNLTAVVRRPRAIRLGLGFVVAGVAVAAGSSLLGGGLSDAIGTILGLWALFAVVLGPQWVRNDLRSDLAELALLRTLPLTGRQVVAAEVAASTLVLTALQLALLSLAYLALLASTQFDLGPAERTRVLLGGVLVLPWLNLLSLLVHNGAALLFPAWLGLGQAHSGRVEALGQTMVLTAAFGVVTALLLVPPAGGGALAFVAARGVLGKYAAVAAGAVGTMVLALETWLLVGWLGRVFERSDMVEFAGLTD